MISWENSTWFASYFLLHFTVNIKNPYCVFAYWILNICMDELTHKHFNQCGKEESEKQERNHENDSLFLIGKSFTIGID